MSEKFSIGTKSSKTNKQTHLLKKINKTIVVTFDLRCDLYIQRIKVFTLVMPMLKYLYINVDNYKMFKVKMSHDCRKRLYRPEANLKKHKKINFFISLHSRKYIFVTKENPVCRMHIFVKYKQTFEYFGLHFGLPQIVEVKWKQANLVFFSNKLILFYVPFDIRYIFNIYHLKSNTKNVLHLAMYSFWHFWRSYPTV